MRDDVWLVLLCCVVFVVPLLSSSLLLLLSFLAFDSCCARQAQREAAELVQKRAGCSESVSLLLSLWVLQQEHEITCQVLSLRSQSAGFQQGGCLR